MHTHHGLYTVYHPRHMWYKRHEIWRIFLLSGEVRGSLKYTFCYRVFWKVQRIPHAQEEKNYMPLNTIAESQQVIGSWVLGGHCRTPSFLLQQFMTFCSEIGFSVSVERFDGINGKKLHGHLSHLHINGGYGPGTPGRRRRRSKCHPQLQATSVSLPVLEVHHSCHSRQRITTSMDHRNRLPCHARLSKQPP